MAKKKKVVETPVEEAPVEEVPVVAPAPKTSYKITLAGKNQDLTYGINGRMASLPCGVEITVSEEVYNAVKAHIIAEGE